MSGNRAAPSARHGMRITRYTHACIRIEQAGRVLVIDPGTWSEPEALDGAGAVLLTHEHSDHVDGERLALLGAPVYAPAGADLPGLKATRLTPGEAFRVASFEVVAVGGRHAPTYDRRPACPNLGYLIDGGVYHPGDSLDVPERPVDTLFVPVHGSWLKTAEAIELVNRIAPRRAFAIHDAQLNRRGLASVNDWLRHETDDGRYRYLEPGETVWRLPTSGR